MAQNITLMGASYSDVPSVLLPKTGGGQAQFDDTTTSNGAIASDITNGKEALVNGAKVIGANSGGGGSGIGTLLNTTALGSFSTSSTTATDTNKDVTVTGINGYDLLIVETSVDTKVASRHSCTTKLIWLLNSTTLGTVSSATIATATWNSKQASGNTNATTRANTTAYGIYPYDCSISTSNSGTATMNMYIRYNSTQTGTINGSYTTRVYGVKIYNLIGG